MKKRMMIQILLLATAKGFERKGRCVLFSKDPLQDYAAFTKECMQTEADRKKLYRVSFRLGRLIRKIVGMVGYRNPEKLQRLVFWLYRKIGITMTGELPGQVQVSECFFSSVYTAEECRCISAMDAGIIAGICGSGRLHFTERITEGCGHCAIGCPKGAKWDTRAWVDEAVAQCREILTLLGVPEEKQFLGTLNAGHPGGMLPLTAEEAETLHNPKLPENLYVADATILPKAMGNPPILTIMALTKKMAGVILERAK